MSAISSILIYCLNYSNCICLREYSNKSDSSRLRCCRDQPYPPAPLIGPFRSAREPSTADFQMGLSHHSLMAVRRIAEWEKRRTSGGWHPGKVSFGGLNKWGRDTFEEVRTAVCNLSNHAFQLLQNGRETAKMEKTCRHLCTFFGVVEITCFPPSKKLDYLSKLRHPGSGSRHCGCLARLCRVHKKIGKNSPGGLQECVGRTTKGKMV